MVALVQLRKDIDEKRSAMKQIFDQAGVDIDFDKVTAIAGTNEEKVIHVRTLNTDLEKMVKEAESLAELSKLHSDHDEREKSLSKVGVPSGNGDDDNNNGKAQSVLGAWRGKSMIDAFIDSDAFKGFRGRSSPNSEVEFGDAKQFNHVLRNTKTLFGETAYVPEVTRNGTVLPLLTAMPTITGLVPSGATGQIAVKYMQEDTNTNAANSVGEGLEKPESGLTFVEKISPVRKIATVIPVTDEMFQDEPQMRSYLEARMGIFLDLAKEKQIWAGTGTAPDIKGLKEYITGGETQTYAQSGTDSVPDAVYKAMTKIRVTGLLIPDAVAMHPNDWQGVRLLRTSDGIYIWGSPSGTAPEAIWGLPVVQSVTIDEGTAIVAAWKVAMQLFQRSAVEFAVSDQHLDYFVKNKLMLRIEERFAFVVYRPTGICAVTGLTEGA